MSKRPLHGGNLWKASRKYGVNVKDLIDFSSNINPLGPSPKAVKALTESLDVMNYYPEPYSGNLKKVLADHLGILQSNLLLGNGAIELIYFLGRHYDSRRIILTAPTFSEYGRGSSESAFKYLKLAREDEFEVDVERLISIIDTHDIVYLCNPNNPTGSIIPRDDVLRVHERCCEVDAILVVDEAFVDYVDEFLDITLRREAAINSNLIVLGSLTKFFSIPGLRLGYLISTKDNVESYDKYLPTWRINSFAEIAGINSLQDKDYIIESISHNERERNYMLEKLKEIPGLTPFKTHANFILVECRESGKRVDEIEDYLGPKGFLIRNCSSFNGLDDYYFRLAVKLRKDNGRLLNLLSSFLQ